MIISQLAAQLERCDSQREAQLLWNKHALVVAQRVFSAEPAEGERLVELFENKLNQSQLLARSCDSILDKIISNKIGGEENLAEIALFMTQSDPKLHILIDLVRQVLTVEEPPMWVLQLVGVVSTRIKQQETRGSETTKLNLAELMANEIIHKIKYCLDYSGPLPNSIYAVQVLTNCVKTLQRFPKIQIVRLNEILNMLMFFIHDPDADGPENELRLLASLEIIHLIIDADASVFEFFHKRIEAEIGPFINEKEYQNPTELQFKLVTSCRKVSNKLKTTTAIS